jgi:hypothetical protein
MSEDFQQLLDELLLDGEDSNDYPAMIVIFKPEGIKVHLNQWQHINPRRIEQAKAHIVAERDRQRIQALRNSKQKEQDDG